MQSCKGRRYKNTANNDNQIARFSSFHTQKCSASGCYSHHPLTHTVLTLPPSKIAKTPPTFPSTGRMWMGAPISQWELKASMFALLRAALSSHPHFLLLYQQPPTGRGAWPPGQHLPCSRHSLNTSCGPFILFIFIFLLLAILFNILPWLLDSRGPFKTLIIKVKSEHKKRGRRIPFCSLEAAN